MSQSERVRSLLAASASICTRHNALRTRVTQPGPFEGGSIARIQGRDRSRLRILGANERNIFIPRYNLTKYLFGDSSLGTWLAVACRRQGAFPFEFLIGASRDEGDTSRDITGGRKNKFQKRGTFPSSRLEIKSTEISRPIAIDHLETQIFLRLPEFSSAFLRLSDHFFEHLCRFRSQLRLRIDRAISSRSLCTRARVIHE